MYLDSVTSRPRHAGYRSSPQVYTSPSEVRAVKVVEFETICLIWWMGTVKSGVSFLRYEAGLGCWVTVVGVNSGRSC